MYCSKEIPFVQRDGEGGPWPVWPPLWIRCCMRKKIMQSRKNESTINPRLKGNKKITDLFWSNTLSPKSKFISCLRCNFPSFWHPDITHQPIPPTNPLSTHLSPGEEAEKKKEKTAKVAENWSQHSNSFKEIHLRQNNDFRGRFDKCIAPRVQWDPGDR